MSSHYAGGGGVLPPPTDLDPNMTVAWAILILVGLVAAASLVHMISDWRETRSPMLFLLLLGGATVGPFAIEPAYDIIMAGWYPPELPVHVATVLGRPLALMVPLMYVGGISWVCYLAYRMVVAGASVRTTVVVFGSLSIIEGLGEMVLSQFEVIRYYGNLATIFGVPWPTLVQNFAMFPIIGVALAALAPHLRGWRWLIVPFVPYSIYIGYVVACTFPNFLAIHGQAPRPLFYLLAAISCVLNGVAGWMAIKSDTAGRYRNPGASLLGTRAPRRLMDGVGSDAA